MLSVVGMLRGLWLAVAVGVVGCASSAPRATVATETPDEGPQIVFVEPARDPQRDATDKLIAELSHEQLEEKRRADEAKAHEERQSARSEDEWLVVARESCRPMHCDGSVIRPLCEGEYDIPTWARVQAATEACANPPPAVQKNGTRVLSAEDWAAWRKRVSGK